MMAAVAPASRPSSTTSSHFSLVHASWRTPKYKSVCDTQSSARPQCCAPHTRRPARPSSALGCTRIQMPAEPLTTPAAPSPEDRPCCALKRVQQRLSLLSFLIGRTMLSKSEIAYRLRALNRIAHIVEYIDPRYIAVIYSL